MRRVIYFLITNLAILIVLGTLLRILGVEPYLTPYGLNYQSLLIFAAIFGMGGAFISLALSKWSAKRLTGKASIRQPHLPDQMATFGISGTKRRGLSALFATHPDLDDRISTLEKSRHPDYKH